MSSQAEIRADFIKRLFAVAISVGFAATFIEMEWVNNGSLPNIREMEQLGILLTGLVLTVLSWDGYLTSIDKKPLNDYPRFAIDIVLVFTYMFFLISSKKPDFWLPVLVVIFSMYVLWDLLTVMEHPRSYKGSLTTQRAHLPDVFRVYIEGVIDKKDTNRGPIITFSWALYFGGLLIIGDRTSEWHGLFLCSFAIVGLCAYRRDKSFKKEGAMVSGFSMWLRALMIAGLLVLAGVHFSAVE